MAKRSTQTLSDPRVLLQAEPFGFGPTAAIADCFPFLQQSCGRIGYAGRAHTLDLQRKLPYDAVYDLTELNDAGEQALLDQLANEYDIVLTAMDFAFAEKARAAGLPVCIYDALTWYWNTIPTVVRQCTYIAQKFLGVQERLAADAASFSDAHVVASLNTGASPFVVPPLVPAEYPLQTSRDKVLFNLGGLSNPFWSVQGTSNYARLVVEAFFAGTGLDTSQVVIAGNAKIAAYLSAYGARNYSRQEMQDLIPTCRWAVMTPGLGNIYDVARYNTRTIWLPPANDSQGQQLKLLVENGLVDAAIDWPDLLSSVAIDYRGDQQFVLTEIYRALNLACQDQGACSTLRELFATHAAAFAKLEAASSRVSELVTRFGAGGAQEVASIVIAQARKGLSHA